jgi:type I restriction enzyme M protein
MNLAVHGGAGLIVVNDSYTDDPHESVGKFDYVLANPRFNDSAFDVKRVQDTRRFPHGSPTAKANYLWLQMCQSALGAGGRAGIVMPNSASDGSKKETAIRQAWVQDDVVEAVVVVGEKMFGSITNPATLWFFNRAKRSHQRGRVLFIDARNTFTVIDAAHRHWTRTQVRELADLVLSWRSGNSPAQNITGLCRTADRSEIAKSGWSLNPGRYVKSPIMMVDDADFLQKRDELRAVLRELSASAGELYETVDNLLAGELKT